jgi:zinc protease
VQFPSIQRDELASGLRVWSLPWTPVPIVTIALLLERGSAQDPADRPGLASLTADLIDEGAGGRDAVQLSDAFARLGTHLDVDVSPDATLLSMTTLAKNLDPALALLGDVLIRPHLAESDLLRIRDLRLNRLRQLKTSASAVAERAFLAAVFGPHPYGHGTFGTSRTLEAASLDDVRAFHQRMFRAARATLIVAGDAPAAAVAESARKHLGGWRSGGPDPEARIPVPAPMPPQCVMIDRPGAPQSELRIGHLGPERRVPEYHALVVLNAALGGQFTSRINQQLREAKGYTYGARTSFDFRCVRGSFSCDTSVQGDATIEAIGDVLAAFDAAGSTHPIDGGELARAKGSLTRGYVRHFETPAHLVRAAIDLAKFQLPDDTFDRYVPEVAAVTAGAVLDAARRFIRAAECAAVIVGDAEKNRAGLGRFQRNVIEVAPEF